MIDTSERVHDTAGLAARLHAEFPLVRIATILEIIRSEQHAVLEDEEAPVVSATVAAGTVELVAQRQSLAELEASIAPIGGGAGWLDRDLWVIEDERAEYAGLVERIGPAFYVSNQSGRRAGAFRSRAAASAACPGGRWRPIYVGSAA